MAAATATPYPASRDSPLFRGGEYATLRFPAESSGTIYSVHSPPASAGGKVVPQAPKGVGSQSLGREGRFKGFKGFKGKGGRLLRSRGFLRFFDGPLGPEGCGLPFPPSWSYGTKRRILVRGTGETIAGKSQPAGRAGLFIKAK